MIYVCSVCSCKLGRNQKFKPKVVFIVLICTTTIVQKKLLDWKKNDLRIFIRIFPYSLNLKSFKQMEIVLIDWVERSNRKIILGYLSHGTYWQNYRIWKLLTWSNYKLGFEKLSYFEICLLMCIKSVLFVLTKQRTLIQST